MKLAFTKMQGAGNDFIVLDATQTPLSDDVTIYKRLADRHFGIGADQILIVGASPEAGVDFSYRIINADGSEVEQCGNGARCFMRFVYEHGLTDKTSVKVRTVSGDIMLQLNEDKSVTVNMGTPVFELARIPFVPDGVSGGLPGRAGGISAIAQDDWQLWPLPLPLSLSDAAATSAGEVRCAVVSMGNPHAVIRVTDVDAVPVAQIGALVERMVYFPQRVNVGFMQVVNRTHVKVRVFERGAGETLACGTGICAAVVCGIRMGWLDESVDVDAHGGRLQISWAGRREGQGKGLSESVWMTGPAQTVFEGVIEL